MRATPLAVCVIAAALSLAACQSVPTAPAEAAKTAAAPGTTVPADDNLNAVLWVQRSAEYQAVSQTIYRAAADKLDIALHEKNWDALVPAERRNAAIGLPPAVIMDIDETVLDNSSYQARLVRDGVEYNEVTWDQWVTEKKAQPLPGVVDFARTATAKGVTILY